MAKRKGSRVDRLRNAVAHADQQDARRQGQIARQIESINGLLILVRAMEIFIEEQDLTDAWTAYRDHVSEEPCYICKRPDNHFGIPHSEAVGDTKTRAEVDAERAAAEETAAPVNPST